MIKILHVAQAVVTTLAIAPVFLNVRSHKANILFAVTIHARLLIEFKIVTRVTALAGEG